MISSSRVIIFDLDGVLIDSKSNMKKSWKAVQLKFDLNNSIDLYGKIPSKFIKISESGISEVESILKLKEVGYNGFLIGEKFMKTRNPMESAHDFIKKIENEI